MISITLKLALFSAILWQANGNDCQYPNRPTNGWGLNYCHCEHGRCENYTCDNGKIRVTWYGPNDSQCKTATSTKILQNGYWISGRSGVDDRKPNPQQSNDGDSGNAVAMTQIGLAAVVLLIFILMYFSS